MLRSIEEEKTKNGKGKRTNNDLYNTTQTKKLRNTKPTKKIKGELRCFGKVNTHVIRGYYAILKILQNS